MKILEKQTIRRRAPRAKNKHGEPNLSKTHNSRQFSRSIGRVNNDIIMEFSPGCGIELM